MSSTTHEQHLTQRIALARAQLQRRTLPAGNLSAEVALQDAALTVHALERQLPAEVLAAHARLELSAEEWSIIWLLAAEALDTECQRLFAALELRGTGISLRTLRSLAYPSAHSRAGHLQLGERGSLRLLGILERDDGGPAELHEARQSWKLSSRFLGFLHGDQTPAPCLRGLMRTADAPRLGELAIGAGVLDEARLALRGRDHIVVVSGPSSTGRRTLLRRACADSATRLLEIDCRGLARDEDALQRQLRAIALELRLAGGHLVLANLDGAVDETPSRLALIGSELVPLVGGTILATCGVRQPPIAWGRAVISIDIGRPTTAQRAALWGRTLGVDDDDAARLAEAYPLAPALIHHAATATKACAAGRPLELAHVHAGIRSVLDDRLGNYARRVAVTQTWDDIVLPPEQLNTVVELMARIRQRAKVYETWGFAAKVGKGLGISALFSGPPGTGKTMIAGLIAQDLGLELYQVDLSKIVSKWIGETEKNLAALFDAAEAGHAILLFDEADSLFGKRTDVRSSNDRNANLETNYLLQRLESFTGICMLTTNHDSQIDGAFHRRLSLHLRFEIPDEAERARLWQATLPAGAPLASTIDFESLGRRYAMTGGYIRNAALRAAFLAADADAEISTSLLDHAARVEYEGMGKLAA